MPAAVRTERDERLWAEAKQQARSEYPDKQGDAFYRLVMGIFKRMRDRTGGGKMAKAEVANPGSRGGRFYMTDAGGVRYGDRPVRPADVARVREDLASALSEWRAGRRAKFLKQTSEGRAKKKKRLLDRMREWAGDELPNVGPRMQEAWGVMGKGYVVTRLGEVLLAKARRYTGTPQLPFGERKPVEKPGSRGGKYYVTDAGEVRYGERPKPIPAPWDDPDFTPEQRAEFLADHLAAEERSRQTFAETQKKIAALRQAREQPVDTAQAVVHDAPRKEEHPMDNNMEALKAIREELATRLANCERGAFPGSRAAREESAALLALDKFDREHPEVLSAIRAEGERNWAYSPEAVERALRGED